MLNNSVDWVSERADQTKPTSSHDLSKEDEERIENMFRTLDLDGNGKVDIHDLSLSLKDSGVNPFYAKEFLERSDQNNSGTISLKEFIHYVKEHEKNLKLVFTTFDKNRDGKLDSDELVRAFKELGIDIDHDEAVRLVQRMDTDGSLNISFNEWRDFLFYAPSHDIKELIKYWRHSSAGDLEQRKEDKALGDGNTMCGMAWDTKPLRESTLPRMKSAIAINLEEDLVPKGFKAFTASYLVLKSLVDRVRKTSLGIQKEKKKLESQQAVSDVRVRMLSCCSADPVPAFPFPTSEIDTCKTYLDIGEDLNVPDDFTAKEMMSGMWWRHLVAGGVAGAVSRTCTAPLDRIKVYLQVHGSMKKMSIKECLTNMLREGGLLSLWRGNGINVLKIAPESAIKFMAYEQAKRAIRWNHSRELSMFERFAAGSLAGGISQTVIYPLEVMKTRLALRKTGEYNSIAHAAKMIYTREGLRSFYRGYVPNLLGIIPYAGIDLAVYETLKNTYISKHGSRDQQPAVALLLACGTISTICGQVCSYPLALVRTRLQAQVVSSVEEEHNCKMSCMFKSIIRREGILGLYRGIAPNFLKVIPAVSISYVVYERCRLLLGVDMT